MNETNDSQRDPSIHRLVDIEVQEVSLVDRAANKHKFLVIKRSDEMDVIESSTEDTAAESAAKMDHESPEGWGEDHQPEHHGMHGPIMTAAVDALQRLTTVVEHLQAHDESSGTRLSELAAELHGVASQLDELAGGPGATAPWLEMPDDEETSADSDDANDGALLGEAEEMLAQAKRAMGQRPQRGTGADSAKRQGSAPANPETTGLSKQIADLTAAVHSLVGTVNTQQQRMAKLEKQHGLPNSKPPGERPARRDVEESSWPMDLNKPLDRANVDKSLSFHDV